MFVSLTLLVSNSDESLLASFSEQKEMKKDFKKPTIQRKGRIEAIKRNKDLSIIRRNAFWENEAKLKELKQLVTRILSYQKKKSFLDKFRCEDFKKSCVTTITKSNSLVLSHALFSFVSRNITFSLVSNTITFETS